MFEGVCVTTVILAPGACGGGLRAAVLATTSGSPAAALTNSQNGQVAAIRVTSELARFEDPVVRCAGCGVGQGRGAPVHARARKINFHPKNTHDLEDVFVLLPNGAQRLIFYNELSPSR